MRDRRIGAVVEEFEDAVFAVGEVVDHIGIGRAREIETRLDRIQLEGSVLKETDARLYEEHEDE